MIKALFKKKLIANDFKFGNSPFEPSNSKPIKSHDLNLKSLITYLELHYQSSDKPYSQVDNIKKIIDLPGVDRLIDANKSEFYKVLSKFSEFIFTHVATIYH